MKVDWLALALFQRRHFDSHWPSAILPQTKEMVAGIKYHQSQLRVSQRERRVR
jgi:hypothetical protein